MRTRWFSFFLEKPGVISPPEEGWCWILFYGPYMHCDTSLWRLVKQVLREFGHDRHLVG